VLLLLGMSLGGGQYAWNSPAIILFFVLGGLLLIGFIVTEIKINDPIIQMRNFLVRNVTLSDALAFFIGFFLFGALSYLPIYFQVIHGDTPTTSGLKLLPVMLGLIGASMFSGIMITKTGYFWPFPVVGSIFLAVGSGLIAGFLSIDIDIYLLSFFIFLIGIGTGLSMQTLIVIVQNAVERVDMATATSAQSFLRSMGGVLGVTIFGAIINNILQNNIPPSELPIVQAGYLAILSLGPDEATFIFTEYVSSLQVIFWVCTGISVLCIFLSLAVKNTKINRVNVEPPTVEA